MKSTSGKIGCLCAGIFFCITLGTMLHAQNPFAAGKTSPSSSTDPVPEKSTSAAPLVYRDKTSGDEALKAQDYEVAASFYAAYRKEAEKHGDLDAVRSAYECEIDAWILGARPVQASALLEKYLLLFPKIRNLSTDLWTAEILLLKRDSAGAEKILIPTLEALSQNDPRRLRAIASMAVVNELRKNYREAAVLYNELSGKAGGMLGRRAAERRILALTADGRTAEAVALLKDLKLNEDERSIEAFRLLNIYLSLKNGAAASIADSWKEAKESPGHPADNFFFLISSLIGDEFFVQKDCASALDAYKLAFHYARLKADSFDALSRVVTTLKSMNKKTEASALAARHLDLFRSPLASPRIKLFAVSLLAGTGRHPEAFALCSAALSDLKGQEKQRENTFEIAFRILLKNKAWIEAGKLVGIYFPDGGKASPAALLRMAAIDEARNNHAGAVKYYLQAAEEDGALFLEASFRAVELLSRLQNYKKVILVAGKILERDSRSPVRFHRAFAREKTSDFSGACTDYLVFAGQSDADPESKAQALFRAAMLRFREKKYRDAESIFGELVRKYPQSPLAPLAACREILSLFNRRQTSAAERKTLELAKRYPESRYAGIALLKLAESYVNSGAAGEAGKLLDGIVKHQIQPSIRAQALYQRALLAYQGKDYRMADELLNGFEKHFPSAPCAADVSYLRGELFRARNEFQSAASSYRKAALLRPGTALEQAALGSEADCLFAVASSDDSSQAFRDALAHYEKLLAREDLLPEYEAMTRYKIARCLQLLGETEQAAAGYKKLLYCVPLKTLPERPRERFWILKGMDALELIALQSADAGLIDAAMEAMSRLNLPGIAEHENYRRRIGELRKLKREIINTGETGK